MNSQITGKSKIKTAIISNLIEPVSNKYLSIFRALAFSLMAIEVSEMRIGGYFHHVLAGTKVRFPYEFLPIGREFTESQVDLLVGIVILSALFCAIGFMYRYSKWVLLVSYTYLFFQDKMFWNNHWYLFLLLAILAVLIDLGKNYSIDVLVKPADRLTVVPRWHYHVFIL